MKKITITFLLFILLANSKAQNLVPNPSFELKNNCPIGLGSPSCALWDTIFSNPPSCRDEVYLPDYFDTTVVGWVSFLETPDYFNACATNPTVKVPGNIFGSQYPLDGDAYVGITTYDLPVPPHNYYYKYDYLGHPIWDSTTNDYARITDTINFREAIGAKLDSNLTIGTKYYVTFWVNRARQDNPNYPYVSGAANNNIGMRFSTVPYTYWNHVMVDNFAQIRDTSIITDSLDWTRISGSFIADSSYSYLIIGNFFDQHNTDTIGVRVGGLVYHLAYYYIDQVCVSSDSTYCYSLPNSIRHNDEASSIKVYPNPFINTLKIETESNQPAKIKIYDELSRLVLDKEFVNSVVLNTETLNSGFYYYEVVEKGRSNVLQIPPPHSKVPCRMTVAV